MAATATPESTSTSSNTYTSAVITSFPFNPLTTQFVAPTYCDAVYDGSIYMVDPQNDCLPPKHPKAETAYYSPGYVCPSGYMTARVDNKGAHSITTVTCCPYRSDIILSAVDPATLSGPWIGLFCTWIAPEATRIGIVHTADTRTWTEQEYVTSPGGVNAYGVRMVYQSTDIAASASSSSATASSSSTTSNAANAAITVAASSGIPTSVAMPLAAVLPVFVLGLIAGALFWWWRRKFRAKNYNLVGGPGTPPNAAGGGSGAANATMRQTDPIHEAPPSLGQQHSYQELQHHNAAYQQQQQHQHQHQHSPIQSLPSTYQSSTAATSVHQQQQTSPVVPHAQQLGHGGAYTSYAGYKPPTAVTPDEAPALSVLQMPMTTTASELPASVPGELADDLRSRTASGTHIDDQKMMGVGPTGQ